MAAGRFTKSWPDVWRAAGNGRHYEASPTMRIDRVEVRVVAPKVPRYTWSDDLPEQFMTNTIVRIYTDAGVEGVGAVANYTSYDYDRYTAETLRHLIPILGGRNPLER